MELRRFTSIVSLISLTVLYSLTSSQSYVVVSMDSSNSEVKMKLAEIYELKGQPRRALDLVYQGCFENLRSHLN